MWNLLGEFSFFAGDAGYVELTDGASDGAEVVADAIKFEFVGATDPRDASTEEDGQTSVEDAGDQAADGGDAWDAWDGGVADGGDVDSDTDSSTPEAGCDCSTRSAAEPGAALWLAMLIYFGRRRHS